MASVAQPILVTRREVYFALSIVWLYFMLVLGDLMRVEGRWSNVFLWAASCIMAIGYFVISFRSMSSRKTGTGAGLSDRVKQLANDSSRKIEAIKVYREETGASLAEVKAAVEAFIGRT